MSDRRTFLRGLISIPLVGGGMTLIGEPAAPVPLVQAAALPALDDPHQRARYAWEAFSAAMRDVAVGADAWTVTGSQRMTPIPPYSLTEVVNRRVNLIHYDYDDRFRSARGPAVFERTTELEL